MKVYLLELFKWHYKNTKCKWLFLYNPFWILFLNTFTHMEVLIPKGKYECTYINETWEIPLPEVMKHRGLIQAGQCCHVFNFVKLGRVHFLHIIFGDRHLPPIVKLNQNLVPCLLFDTGWLKTLLFWGYPYHPFGWPVGLGHPAVFEVTVKEEELAAVVVVWLHGHVDLLWWDIQAGMYFMVSVRFSEKKCIHKYLLTTFSDQKNHRHNFVTTRVGKVALKRILVQLQIT